MCKKHLLIEQLPTKKINEGSKQALEGEASRKMQKAGREKARRRYGLRSPSKESVGRYGLHRVDSSAAKSVGRNWIDDPSDQMIPPAAMWGEEILPG